MIQPQTRWPFSTNSWSEESRQVTPRLFTKDALARYSQATKKRIQAGQARSAIEQLRDRDPPLIWKSDRGDYAFEDTGFLRWFQAAHGARMRQGP